MDPRSEQSPVGNEASGYPSTFNTTAKVRPRAEELDSGTNTGECRDPATIKRPRLDTSQAETRPSPTTTTPLATASQRPTARNPLDRSTNPDPTCSARNLGQAPPVQAPPLAAQQATSTQHGESTPQILGSIKSNSRYRILHRIVCPARFHLSRPTCFTEAPQRTQVDVEDDQSACPEVHLDGTGITAVQSISSFINNETDLAFIVFHYYKCIFHDGCNRTAAMDLSQGLGAGQDSAIRYTETIFMVSPTLKTLLTRTTKSYMTPLVAQNPNITYHFEGDIEKDREDEYPMSFFHRILSMLKSRLLDTADVHQKQECNSLYEYIESKHGRLIEQVNSLLTQGLVERTNLQCLFSPNDIVVARIGGGLEGFVIRDWPDDDSVIRIDCWQWAYDGKSFRRRPATLTTATIWGNIDGAMPKSVASVRSLNVFPLAFCTKEEREHLLARGERFVRLRQQKFIAYDRGGLESEHVDVRQPVLVCFEAAYVSNVVFLTE